MSVKPVCWGPPQENVKSEMWLMRGGPRRSGRRAEMPTYRSGFTSLLSNPAASRLYEMLINQPAWS